MAGSAAETRPVVSRRREVSHASARSLLTTLLGEFVLPRDRPVWTSVLVDALATFDVEEKSARQALARVAAEGWLISERAGRRVRWVLTPTGRRLLAEGAERIHGFGTGADPGTSAATATATATGFGDDRDWDGIWLVLLVSVPESRRELRHKLRTRLSWAGLGSPTPGVWITPHPDREGEAMEILEELGLAAEAMSFTARYGAAGSRRTMVSRAWDLSELAGHYEEFTREFAELRPEGGDAVLHAQTRLVHEWRRFPFLDPLLPRELLPDRWSGAEAAGLFHRRHAEWRPAAQRRWDELTERT